LYFLSFPFRGERQYGKFSLLSPPLKADSQQRVCLPTIYNLKKDHKMADLRHKSHNGSKQLFAVLIYDVKEQI
jgi:hypothetical protein